MISIESYIFFTSCVSLLLFAGCQIIKTRSQRFDDEQSTEFQCQEQLDMISRGLFNATGLHISATVFLFSVSPFFYNGPTYFDWRILSIFLGPFLVVYASLFLQPIFFMFFVFWRKHTIPSSFLVALGKNCLCFLVAATAVFFLLMYTDVPFIFIFFFTDNVYEKIIW